MQPGGGYLYGNGNGNGSGFRYVRGQPCRPPMPPEQQMTPQEREAVLMAAGRLAAEYLVNRGDLPPNALENRPPAPIPLPGVGGGQQPAFWPQHHQQPPVPRTFHSQFHGRPPAPQQRQAWPQAQPHPFPFQGQHQQRPPATQRRFLGPRPFQGGRGPFLKRPRQRPFPYGPGPAPAQVQAAAPVVPASKNKQDDDNEHSAPAGGEAGDSQPTAAAQPDVPATGSQQTDEPRSSALGANASESS